MKDIRWNELKNRRLKRTRGVSFEEILQTKFIMFDEHPKQNNQQLMYFYYRNYVWAVPFVRERNYIFLKTLYPDRKLTRLFNRGELYEKEN